MKKYYKNEGTDVCKRLPNRSKQACKAMAMNLGIKYTKATRKWSKEEIDILLHHYSEEGGNVYLRLDGINRNSCTYMAQRLGISYTGYGVINNNYVKEYFSWLKGKICQQKLSETAVYITIPIVIKGRTQELKLLISEIDDGGFIISDKGFIMSNKIMCEIGRNLDINSIISSFGIEINKDGELVNKCFYENLFESIEVMRSCVSFLAIYCLN